jgi:hypothetical protein
MQDSFLNTTPSIQNDNSRISVILIYYYALCKVAGGLGKRFSRCFSCHRCRHKHTCGVVVATTRICLRGSGFKSPWHHLYFLFYLDVGCTGEWEWVLWGDGMGKAEHGMTKHGNGKGRIRNENGRTENGGRTRNDRLPCSLNK